jgi:hypothetical protein
VRAGGKHSVVVATDGRAWCFGSNKHGQCGFEINAFSGFQQYPKPNPTPLLLGTIKDTTFSSMYISPPKACCGVGVNATTAAGPSCSADGFYWKAIGKSIPCPFNHARVRDMSLGRRHTIVRTSDKRLYSFGSDYGGQLMRGSGNIGIENSNPDISEVGLYNFGYGNQPVVDYAAGGDSSIVQTQRGYCRPGNHSVDRRVPCLRCDPGSFQPDVGGLTDSLWSFDQSVRQRYSVLMALEYLATPTYLTCPPCDAGSFSEAGAPECEACLPGTYSFHGASVCPPPPFSH